MPDVATHTESVDASYHGGDGDARQVPFHSVPASAARSDSHSRTVPSVSTTTSGAPSRAKPSPTTLPTPAICATGAGVRTVSHR